MRFGQTFVLKTARGKIAAGLAVILFGVIAVLAAPTAGDKLLCGIVVLVGAALVALGVRQDRAEKQALRNGGDKKEAK